VYAWEAGRGELPDINEGKEFEELLCRVVWGMEGGANFYLRGKSIQLTNTG
jgi:hypothetical protein